MPGHADPVLCPIVKVLTERSKELISEIYDSLITVLEFLPVHQLLKWK